MHSKVIRRFTSLDAMILVGVMAAGLVRLPTVWPEAWEVFRRVDLTHLAEDGFPGRNFEAWPQSGRMDSMGRMSSQLIAAILGWEPTPWGFRKWDGSRSTRKEWLENWGMVRTNSTKGGKAAGYAAAGEAYVLAFPLLLFATAGMILVRWRRPRPGPGMLWQQPGWCGCVAAVVGVVAGLGEEAIIGWDAYTVLVPAMVLLAWLVLLLAGRWSAEASWVDRTGRGLALGWLTLIPLYVIGFALPYFR